MAPIFFRLPVPTCPSVRVHSAGRGCSSFCCCKFRKHDVSTSPGRLLVRSRAGVGPAALSNSAPEALNRQAAGVQLTSLVGKGVEFRHNQHWWMQMHGHDFSAVAFLPERDAYAASAEEKVVRVLEAPRVFFDTLAALCGVRLQPRQVRGCPPGGPEAAATISSIKLAPCTVQ